MIRLLPLALVLAGCSLFDAGPKPPPLAELRVAPETVTVDGQDLVLSTDLWIDLMPGPSSSYPRRLIGIFYVETADSTAFPAGVTVEAAFVVNGRDVWATDLPEEGASDLQRPYRLVRVGRDGPAWPTEIHVDVVVRLRDERGQSYLLRAEGEYVEGAE